MAVHAGSLNLQDAGNFEFTQDGGSLNGGL
jgi:hypothetical protein